MSNDSKIEIILAAKDMTERTLQTFKGHIEAITKSVFSLKGGLVTLTGGYGLKKLFDSLNHTAESASDFYETFSKVQTLFGKEKAEELKQWGEAADYSMGLSSQAALDAVGNMGNMFQQLGAGNDQALNLSKGMVQLSADIASFYNVAGGSAQVLEAMQAAFRGEYDALQRYIPDISAAAVQERALADTHKHNATQLTALEKAIAAQELIIKSAGKATGDFARTSGGLANQERILDSQIDNLVKNIGKNLLPLKLQIVSGTNSWIKANKKLIEQKIPEEFEAIAKSMQKILEAASLRSVTNTFGQAVELSKQGLLDLTEFAKKGFIERQKMVDDILAKQKQIGSNIYRGKIDAATPGYNTIYKPQAPAATASVKSAAPSFIIPHPTTGAGLEEAMMERARLGSKYLSLDWNQLIPEWKRQIMVYDAEHLGGHGQTDMFMGMADANKRAMQMMEDDQQAAYEKMLKDADWWSKSMSDAFSGWATTYSSRLNDMVWGSKVSFNDIGTSFAKMLTQMAIQSEMTDIGKSLFGAEGLLSSFLSNIGGRAGGGTVYPGQTVWVGENGPELLTLGRAGGYVTPNSRIGDGAIDVQVNVTNRTGVAIEKSNVRIVRPSQGKIIANLELKRKLSGRQWSE